ncbi:hypothetical protein GCM10008937_01230 [Deinococcus depolymerans]|uniref:Uncharacterized protein n=1 Tax=Deinococcus depolymerans TaxID=392408 RepID=A0ABN1BH84_9DEIO
MGVIRTPIEWLAETAGSERMRLAELPRRVGEKRPSGRGAGNPVPCRVASETDGSPYQRRTGASPTPWCMQGPAVGTVRVMVV